MVLRGSGCRRMTCRSASSVRWNMAGNGRSTTRSPNGDPVTEILQDFPIAAPPARVYEAVSSPALLDQWWTHRSSGSPVLGATFELDFGPAYHWKAEVTRADPGVAF